MGLECLELVTAGGGGSPQARHPLATAAVDRQRLLISWSGPFHPSRHKEGLPSWADGPGGLWQPFLSSFLPRFAVLLAAALPSLGQQCSWAVAVA